MDVSKDYENYFNATVLEKVNTERRGEERYPTDDEFYSALHRKKELRINLPILRSLNLHDRSYGMEQAMMGDIFLSELALIVRTLVMDETAIDMGQPEEDYKFFLSIQSTVLLICVVAELLLEPYYPNRFAYQFGFDPGVLSNRLSFTRALR
ncbi:hypothetical protein Cgig2_027878 [Carnegiea gigantea]|uniref:Uncharacterized protein n=1 Tax=Carnegiea gigantea TaxID=171969 RepID=A0A9Q1QKM9_9CARY|nr:hypothetical protein Cgig2_027878 [Carnegiea gigantea]